MKKLLLTLLLGLVSTSAMAEWTKIADDASDKFSIYADRSTIRKNGDKVKMWTLVDFKTEQEFSGGRYFSNKTQEEFDCKDDQSRTMFVTLHSLNMGQGEVVYTVRSPSEWEPVPPGSIIEVSWKTACGKK